MSLSLVLIVLGAAFLHAFWNALVKGSDDKTIVLGFIALGHVLPGLVIVALAPAPEWDIAPFILVSTLIRWGYYYFLNVAYRMADFSLVYPIARGFAPVLVALGAQIWIGESLSVLTWLGVLVVAIGVMILAGNIFAKSLPLMLLLSVGIVAICIASYSLVDGVGIRQSQSIMGYIGWLLISEFCVVLFIFSAHRSRLFSMSVKTCLLSVFSGFLAAAAYALVLYAKTEAPLGVVSALRETSVIFAAMIGVFWFGEGPKRRRLLAGVIVGIGTILTGLEN